MRRLADVARLNTLMRRLGAASERGGAPRRLARRDHRRRHQAGCGRRAAPPGHSCTEGRAAAERRACVAGRLHSRAAGLAGPQPVHRPGSEDRLLPLRLLRAGAGEDRARTRPGLGRRRGDAAAEARGCGDGRGVVRKDRSRVIPVPRHYTGRPAIDPPSTRHRPAVVSTQGRRDPVVRRGAIEMNVEPARVYCLSKRTFQARAVLIVKPSTSASAPRVKVK